MPEIPAELRSAVANLLEWITTLDRQQKALAQILHDKLGVTEAELRLAGFLPADLRQSRLDAASQTTEALEKFLKELTRH